MNSLRGSQIMHLVTTGCASCNDDVFIRLRADLWQQLAFSDRYGDIEMSFGIPERTCHPATTRIQVCHLRTRNAFEKRFCGSEADPLISDDNGHAAVFGRWAYEVAVRSR